MDEIKRGKIHIENGTPRHWLEHVGHKQSAKHYQSEKGIIFVTHRSLYALIFAVIMVMPLSL
jgi:hypothetical protein